MRPRQPSGEFLQEHGGGDRPGRPAAGIHDVGNVALDLIAVLVEERHRPDAIPRTVRHAADLLHPRRRRAEEAARNFSEGDDTGAGERGDIDQMCGAELARVP